MHPTRNRSTTAVLSLLLATSNIAADEEKQEAVERPKFELLRFEEDWSVLSGVDGTASGDVFDPIKYVPVNDWLWLSFGGQARSRVEYWNGFGFGGPGDREDTIWHNRFRAHVDAHATEYLRVFVEGKSAFSTARDLPGGRRQLDVDELALQNGFVDLRIPIQDSAVTLRPGRQELLFGNQRLVSPRDWTNVRRTWDGGSAILTTEDWTVTGFWTQLVEEEKYSHNESDSGIQLYGLYAAGELPASTLGLDLYFLGLARDEDEVTGFNGTAGREDRFTIGARADGNILDTGLDFELEGAYQFGEVGRGDINAFMVASQLGYGIAIPTNPRPFVGFDYTSGDDSAGGDVETFNPLFPTGHKYHGFIDTIGRYNLIDLTTGLSLKPTRKLTTAATTHFFWRASEDDALYNGGGGVVRAGNLGNSKEVGTEIDVTAAYQLDRHLFGLLGYSHFFPGKFIRQSGSSDDIDFVYMLLQYTI